MPQISGLSKNKKAPDLSTELVKKTGWTQAYAALAPLGFWLNGKTDDTTKVGNMVEYLLCGDYSVTSTLTPELALSGSVRDKTQYNGTAKDETQVSQHSATLLLMYKPIPMLTIRPKAGMPLAFLSEGGALPNFRVGLDVWATVP